MSESRVALNNSIFPCIEKRIRPIRQRQAERQVAQSFVDEYLKNHNNLSVKATEEKYTKITARILISSEKADSTVAPSKVKGRN